MLFPIVVAGAAAFALVMLACYFAFTATERKITGRNSLSAIESYTWQGDTQTALQAPFFERVVAPLNMNLISLGKRYTPGGYVDGVRRKLMTAGRRGPDELDKFMALRVASIFAVPFAALVILPFLPFAPRMRGWIFLLVAVVLLIGPDAKLNRAAQARQKAIRRALPDILDLLTISVEAGLGFEQAVDRITDAVPGPLSDEFNRMIGEMRAGSARAEALQGLEMRTGVDDVKSFVMSMIQADTFGVSIGRVLRAQADEMRIKRRQMAQEAAQKAPVKMLFPMVFLIFPALFTVILGPAMINIMQNVK